ncbi:hypothetical protein C8Q80DRAFT_828213 [Daedaleopsis nitida]|nr:hypothetical protein C8Q80DRAFT_828213 [Daedaleopsis nitida]
MASSRSTTLQSDDADEAVRALKERYAERMRERERVPDLIQKTYRDAWSRFYDWEPAYCQQIIQCLLSPSPSLSSTSTLNYSCPENDAMQVDTDKSFTFWSMDSDAAPVTMDAEDIVLPPFSIKDYGYPKYEACTPATRNIRHDAEPHTIHQLQFIPYADEPGFRPRHYASRYDTFAWQASWYDVDFKLVVLDAVWSLRNSGISLSTMDEHDFAFFPQVADGDSRSISDLIRTLRHRDLVQWNDVNPMEQIDALRTTSKYSLWTSVTRLESMFCPNIGCISAGCLAHKHPRPLLSHVQPKKTNLDLSEDADKRPCGPECYRLDLTNKPLGNDILMLNEDVRDMLKLFPDAPICKLAMLCKVDCSDVYYTRGHYLPDGKPSRFYDNQAIVPDRRPANVDTTVCSHEGPCDSSRRCVCVAANQDCGRRCRCGPGCKTRRGCKCEGPCLWNGNPVCECIWKFRECSPDFCQRHKKKNKKGERPKHCCANMAIQKDQKPNLVVRVGSFGMGTFTTTPLRKDTFLGEYVGELYPLHPDEDCVEDYHARMESASRKVNRYRHLNYMFTLGDDAVDGKDKRGSMGNGEGDDDRLTPVVDAATVGDPTRCLNDSLNNPQRLNAEATRINVDGDERIYFYTTKAVEAGAELLLGYGEGYWQNTDDRSTEDEQEAAARDGPSRGESPSEEHFLAETEDEKTDEEADELDGEVYDG